MSSQIIKIYENEFGRVAQYWKNFCKNEVPRVGYRADQHAYFNEILLKYNARLSSDMLKLVFRSNEDRVAFLLRWS